MRFKCDNCFDFDFCEKCYNYYALERRDLKTVYSTSHKTYHTFTKLMLSSGNQNSLKDLNHIEASGANGHEEVKEGNTQ